MDRLACVDVPALPLQLLVARHPEWMTAPASADSSKYGTRSVFSGSAQKTRARRRPPLLTEKTERVPYFPPIAVIDKDEPQGRILWVNEEAHRHRVLPGMRYAAGLSLARELRAGVVETGQIEAGVATLTERMRRFTPEVEPAAQDPGIFWLNASGFTRLHPDLGRWAQDVINDLTAAGFAARIAVGFTRFGAYAAVRNPVHFFRAERAPTDATARKSVRGDAAHHRNFGASVSLSRRAQPHPEDHPTPLRSVLVFPTAEAEDAATRRVSLTRLGLAPELRDTLRMLGVHTVEDFLRLPADGIARRFGEDAHRLHRLANGDLWTPLSPAPPPEPVGARVPFDMPEESVPRLLFLVKRLLPPLLERLAERRLALTAVHLHLDLEKRGRRTESVSTAAPTLDLRQILDLVHLRLQATRLAAGVEVLTLELVGVDATTQQLELFAQRSARDLAAANRALARLRAEFGPHAVVWPRLREGHLPEAQFVWEPLEQVRLPEVRNPFRFFGQRSEDPHASSTPSADRKIGTGSVLPRTLVRRLQTRPLALPPRGRHEPDGWLVRGLERGPVLRTLGPYFVTGGWWAREVQRDYHFVETQHGDLLWIFYDRPRRRWFLQGSVE